MNQNCVYVIAVNNYDGTVFYKIGVSTDVRARVPGIQTCCPLPIDHVLYLPIPRGVSSIKVERQLHSKFEPYRSSGEWFRFDFREANQLEDFRQGCREVVNPILGSEWAWVTYTVDELKEGKIIDKNKARKKAAAKEQAEKFRQHLRAKAGLAPSFWGGRALHIW